MNRIQSKSNSQHPNSSAMSHTILIVEDEAVSQKLATMLLEKAGYTVLLANNGIQALQCLAKNSISAILMDITMPGMDGIEAAVLIRDQEYGTDQHTPIIALTANAMKIDQDRVFEAGMDAYITKPFQIQELLETIELVIQKQQEKAIAPSPQPPQIQMPVATERPKELAIHGDVQIDNYFWLRERENLEVIRYLEDENSYTAARTAHTDALCKALYKEMRGRIQEEDLSVPEQIDSIYYYNRTAEGKQYVMHCRRRGSMQAAEEVILDENELAEEHDFLQIGDVALSPNHQLMAYLVNTDGGESYTLYVKDLERGTYLADRVSDLSYGLEWGNDNRTIFYVTHDEAMRPNKLFRHHLGDDPANDTLLHHETDDAFFLGVSKTKSKAYILLTLNSNVTSEVWFIPADEPHTRPQIIHPREQNVEYSVTHHTDHFIITTNDQAINFRTLLAPVDAVEKQNWQELIAHREQVKIDRVEPFLNYLVIYERESGLRQIRIRNMQSEAEERVKFPDPVYTFYPSWNPNFDSDTLRFTYTSLTTPNSVYDYSLVDHSWTLRKQQPVLGGYDATRYESERLFATSKDGEQVPISLIRRKDSSQQEATPMLLYGYGSYDVSIDPSFNSNRLSLLDRGVTFAIAHVRGGGAMGRQWYEGGKLLNKKNTFTDFITCAEYLIEKGYTKPSKLVAHGRSAGGLLMGAITNMRPDLFAGIVAGVPFVDVINTMLDASIPLTVTEYEEWGNPNIREYYEYMKSYSPYDNIEAKAYPNILATAGLNDPRVQYWEPAKWVAKLRALKTDDNLVLLKTNMGAGHGGASGRFDYLEELAFEYAFMLDIWGLLDSDSTEIVNY